MAEPGWSPCFHRLLQTCLLQLGCFQLPAPGPALARLHTGVTAAASAEHLSTQTPLTAMFPSFLLLWTPRCLCLNVSVYPHREAILSSGASSHLSLMLFWPQHSLLNLPHSDPAPSPITWPYLLLFSLPSTSAATQASLPVLRHQACSSHLRTFAAAVPSTLNALPPRHPNDSLLHLFQVLPPGHILSEDLPDHLSKMMSASSIL